MQNLEVFNADSIRALATKLNAKSLSIKYNGLRRAVLEGEDFRFEIDETDSGFCLTANLSKAFDKAFDNFGDLNKFLTELELAHSIIPSTFSETE